MARNQSIRPVLAFLMLALFAFSITPKQLLHNFLANHKDTPLQCSTDNHERISVAGFNCGCDNLVVESPFVDALIGAEIIAPQSYSEHVNTQVNGFISVNQFYFELRGPPSLT